MRLPSGGDVATLRRVLGRDLPPKARVLAERPGRGLCTLREGDEVPGSVVFTDFQGRRPGCIWGVALLTTSITGVVRARLEVRAPGLGPGRLSAFPAPMLTEAEVATRSAGYHRNLENHLHVQRLTKDTGFTVKVRKQDRVMDMISSGVVDLFHEVAGTTGMRAAFWGSSPPAASRAAPCLLLAMRSPQRERGPRLGCRQATWTSEK